MLETIRMSKIIYKKSWLLIALSLLLLFKMYPSFRDNVLRLLVSKAYFATFSTDSSTARLRQVLQTTCMQSPELECEPNEWTSNKSVIETVDRYFMADLDPLIVIGESAEIPADTLSPSGPSAANQVASKSGTLYSEGYFQLRVFLASDSETCWSFGVRAKHDDPAPVNLTLWLDDEKIGELSYAKGDKTWETLSGYSSAGPGAYWLRVWFVNDYLDQELNADRNAYIEHIQIVQAEEALCEGS
jgi:hypothetical protein